MAVAALSAARRGQPFRLPLGRPDGAHEACAAGGVGGLGEGAGIRDYDQRSGLATG